ncbi:MAG TPA: carboxylesterase family protein [Steroidobacteraceae bacterium]|jgi:para-nitrobenzyl esterase|nr:carboxylesterase family protein [Steroidobacteraceae bacterium]
MNKEAADQPNQAEQLTTRRDFLAGAATAAAAASASVSTLLSSTAAAQEAAPVRPLGGSATGKIFVETDTAYGRVQGIQTTGIKQFKGIPYGASTGGRNRFMPPKKPVAWKGVRECFAHGQISPQALTDLRSDYGIMIHWDYQPGGMGEDCLNLNVWTPGLKDGAKRPVLVCFHGGGFTTGSSNALGYDGAQLARFGDVVVVCVNHRLAAFGYTQLADLGAPAEFASAGVAGIMDLTASLEWVRDNIENFGGNPNNVMIFGQSGGGAKTTSMLATPAAKGLFHRAAVQSGSMLKFVPRDRATASAEALLKQLEIPKSRIADLQKISWQQLLEAQVAVGGAGPGAGVGPVLDGKYLTHDPFDPAAPPESAAIPLIVSTTLEDAALGLSNFTLSEADLKALIEKRYKDKGADILALYRKYYPEKSPYLIQAMLFTDSGFRRSAIKQAELKAAQGTGAIYMYQWDWPTPAFGGRYGAVHGLDVSGSFREARDGNDMARVADQLSSSWVAFAKTGNPNNSRIPPWPTFDAKTRATMVFGTPTQMENDPRGEIRSFWAQMPPPAGLLG